MTSHLKHEGLIAFRKDYGLTQSELGRKLGFSRSYIYSVENKYIKAVRGSYGL